MIKKWRKNGKKIVGNWNFSELDFNYFMVYVEQT